MATCSFIKERKQTAGSMGRVIQYVSQPKKTMDEEGNRYLTGVNCVADVAMQSFMATKHLYGKDTGTFFYQYTQSFSPEEDLTPTQAHKIGLELAEQFFPGCEVLVATHVDRQHLHSHLVVNSVHPDTGKKLHFTPRTLEEMRKVSDQICMEHGFHSQAVPTGPPDKGAKGRGIPGGYAGRELEVPAHHYGGGSHESSRQPRRICTGDGKTGLPGTLGEKPEVYYLHHTCRNEVQRRQAARAKIQKGEYGA